MVDPLPKQTGASDLSGVWRSPRVVLAVIAAPARHFGDGPDFQPWVHEPPPAAGSPRTVILICLLYLRDSRETLNHSDDLVTSVALEATELDQLADPLHDGTLLRSTGHRYAAATLEIEKPFFTENVQSTEHGVLIHAEDSGHVFRQGKALTGSSLSLGDGSADLCCHLVVQRSGFSSVDLDIKHGTRHSRSVRIELPGSA